MIFSLSEAIEAEKKKASQTDSVESYEYAIMRMKEMTGEDDIDLMVSKFIEREDRNFALFNYVNEQDGHIERLKEQIDEVSICFSTHCTHKTFSNSEICCKFALSMCGPVLDSSTLGTGVSMLYIYFFLAKVQIYLPHMSIGAFVCTVVHYDLKTIYMYILARKKCPQIQGGHKIEGYLF